MRISIPDDVSFILSTLENNGFEAYIVGGCVRDMLLSKIPKDWDITTSAKPNEIIDIFKDYNIIDTGTKFGTVGVVINHTMYEITTYRIDGDYKNSRSPQNVEYTDDIVIDLSRRDFTVNAIAYNEKVGIVDPFNGMKDIKNKGLRCVGNPDARFKEDALRIIRALRFASVYNFSIEVNTANAIIMNRHLLLNISVERIATEFNKLLCGENVSYILKRYKMVFAVFMPEIVSTFDCRQNTLHHNKNVWKHTVSAVSNIRNDLLLRMVMLFHDIGKPIALVTDNKGTDHFKNHERFSAELAKNILQRLKYPNDFIHTVLTLILYHDVRLKSDRVIIKRLLNVIGEENFRLLLEIQKADILAQSKYLREEKLNDLYQGELIFNEIILNNECYDLKQLNINGSDLIKLGITKGIEIGNILNILLQKVIEGEVDNVKDDLISNAKSIYEAKE